jgi:hypothetical protein
MNSMSGARESLGLRAGNRCGHDPRAPRAFVPPPQHKPRPGVLVQLIRRVRAYFDDPARLPTLNAANGSPRRQRSERRESCILRPPDLALRRYGSPRAAQPV